jgi:hypothetical protein
MIRNGGISMTAIGLFLAAAAFCAGGAMAQTRPANDGGDTLDTSAPAPVGMEAGPAAAAAAAPVADSNAVEALPAEPSEGGFILPIEGDVFYETQLRVVAALPPAPPASMVLLVDGYPETNPLTVSEGLVSAVLTGLKSGVHDLALLYFNERTEIIGKQEIRFFIRLPEPVKTARSGALRQFGRIVGKVDWKNGEAKGRVISQSELHLKSPKDSIPSLVAGTPQTPVSEQLEALSEAAYNLKYKQMEAYGKILLRTDENRFRQGANRITANVKYGPWASIKVGDVYPLYNPLSLNGTRVRGGEGVLSLTTGDITWGTFRYVQGQSRREVPSYIVNYDTGNGTRIDTVPGTFSQNLVAGRIGFGGGPNFDLGLSLMKASDDEGSEEKQAINNLLHGTRPAENLVPGLDFRAGFWDGKIQVFGNAAMSLYTKDKSLGAFHPDTFDVAFNPEDYRKYFIFNSTTRGWQYLVSNEETNEDPDVMGFVGATTAYEAGIVSSVPFEGVVSETEFTWSHLGLDYHSEGNPFLGGNPGDGFTFIQKLLVLDRRVSVGLELGNYLQDLGLFTQTQRNLKVELRFTPGPYNPSFWVGGGRTNIAPEEHYAHQFSSSFLNFNTGGYHQFQLPGAKLYTTLLYNFTQSEYALVSQYPDDDLEQFPINRTNIVNAMLQYKMRNVGFVPRLAYTFSNNGIQLPTNSVTMGFILPIVDNAVKLDMAGSVGQYPESNEKNDLSLGGSANVEYVLGPQQTFRLREKIVQYGVRRHLTVGADYELFF